MAIMIITFGTLTFFAIMIVALVRFAAKVSTEQKEQDDIRKRFAQEKGWRYTSQGNRKYSLASPFGSSIEWEMTITVGEDSSTTTWCAPSLKTEETVFIFQKRSHLTREHREKAYQIVGVIAKPFGRDILSPLKTLLNGDEFTLDQPSLREKFHAFAFDRSVARALLNHKTEDLLSVWMRHPELSQIERESLSVNLGTQGLQVNFSGIATTPATMALLVDLGIQMATSYRYR